MMRDFIFVAIIALLPCAYANADLGTIDVSETGMGSNLVMTIHTAYPTGPQATSNGWGVYVGVQNVRLTKDASHDWPSIAGFPSQGAAISTFCVDIWDWSSSGPVPSQVVNLGGAPDKHQEPDIPGPMGNQRAALLAELLNSHWPTVGSLDNITAAALQAAIWEIVNEPIPSSASGYDVTQGQFYLTYSGADQQTALGKANTWLHSLDQHLAGVDAGDYLAVTSTQGQDYIVRVPLPAAVLLGLLGLGAAGLKLRKYA